ncbi:MAG: NADPH-dependent F420 reductase [Gemmatimonadales bacterium]
MKVGILGSGVVGQALGVGFAREGHDVKLGTRKPDDPKVVAWAQRAGARASAGTFADAARVAELAVLATRWDGTENAIKLADPKQLTGKIVIDVTNPLRFGEAGPPGLALGFNDSGGERVQAWLPGAKVVKAFNTVNAAYMHQPALPGGPPDMFICGNDAGAKRAVSDICRTFGWQVTDIGAIDGARLLEPLAVLYVRVAILTGSWDLAWKLLRKA